MSPQPIQYGGAELDLSARFFQSATVVASPAGAAQTIIASLTINEDIALMEGVLLVGYAAYTVGASGVSVQFRLRRTDTNGTVVKSSGLMTRVAGDLQADTIVGVDSGIAVLNQVYVLTMIVTSGAATSTVSAVTLAAFVV